MRFSPFQRTIYKVDYKLMSPCPRSIFQSYAPRYIGNLVSVLSMFYFVKRLSAFRTVAKPFADFWCYPRFIFYHEFGAYIEFFFLTIDKVFCYLRRYLLFPYF